MIALQASAADDVEAPVLLALIWKATHSPAIREPLVHSRQAFIKHGPVWPEDRAQ